MKARVLEQLVAMDLDQRVAALGGLDRDLWPDEFAGMEIAYDISTNKNVLRKK